MTLQRLNADCVSLCGKKFGEAWDEPVAAGARLRLPFDTSWP